MAEQSDFLKKVYDKYLGTDYQWGDSDLNPKREIARTSEEDWEDEQQAIISTIAVRVKELKEQAASFKKFKKNEAIDNDNFTTVSSGVGGNADPSSDVNEAELKLKMAVGGNIGNSHIVFPDIPVSDDVDFLLSELEALTLSIIAPIDLEGPPDGFINDTSNLLYNVGCDDISIYEDTDISETNSSFDSLKNGITSNDNDSISNDDDNDGGPASSNKTVAEAADIASDNLNYERDKAAAEQEAQIKACLVAEIGILQAILSLLKCVSAMKKALLLVMSIVTPIVKMVAFAAQCWINPPAAAQVIQMVTEKIAALLVTVIGIILQELWNLLDLDCQTEVVQSVLDQINDILSGVDSIMSMTDSLINFGKSQTKVTMASLKDSYQKLKQTSQWDAWGEDLMDAASWENLQETLGKSVDSQLLGNEGWSAAGIQNMLSAVAPSGIKDKINGLIESSKIAVSQAQSMLSRVDGEGSSSLAQKLTDMQEFLGPLRIR